MLYFAYGSNMCSGRLRKRVPSAKPRFRARLKGHRLCFHKQSDDGSAKSDALTTNKPSDVVWGVVFEINQAEKAQLDAAEGLSHGYNGATVTVLDEEGRGHEVFIYVADPDYINSELTPYSWYKRFVLEGARQHGLPPEYIRMIELVQDAADQNRDRDARERAVEC